METTSDIRLRRDDGSEALLSRRAYDPTVFQNLADGGLKPLAARVLAARGITDAAQAKPDAKELPGITGGAAAAAAQLLAGLIRDGRKICVFGDYDADGMCATTLAKLALEACGEEYGTKVDWLLSSREHEDRSLDQSMVRRAHAMGAQAVLTVDGGSTACAGAELAKQLGMTLIVTDHHPLAGAPVVADITVNPQLEGSGLPSRHMCGTAVMLCVVRELFRRSASKLRASRYVDLAAVATMADVMPLDDEFNRTVVMAGVAAIRKGRCRPLFKAIMDSSKSQVTPRQISHSIAPMLNAAQRMHRAESGVEALLAEDIAKAREHAGELAGLNRERRQKGEQLLREANEQVDGTAVNGGIVVFGENWQPGLVGIIAGQLSTEHGVPAAVACRHKGHVQGSARCPKGTSLQRILKGVEKEDSAIMMRWGGHDRAVGFRLGGDINKFRELFARHAQNEENVPEETATDGSPTVAELTDGSLHQLRDVPWGKEEFPLPQFDGEFTVLSSWPDSNGNGYVHKLGLGDGEVRAWSKKRLGEDGDTVDLVYEVSMDIVAPGPPFIYPRRF